MKLSQIVQESEDQEAALEFNGLVLAVARSDPYTQGFGQPSFNCIHCGERFDLTQRDINKLHKPDCIWLRCYRLAELSQ